MYRRLIGRNSPFFFSVLPTTVSFEALARGFTWDQWYYTWLLFGYMSIEHFFHTVPACDRGTDRQTASPIPNSRSSIDELYKNIHTRKED